MAQKLTKQGLHISGTKEYLTPISHLLIIVILTSLTTFPFIFDSYTTPKLLIASIGLLIISIRFLKWSSTTKFNTLPRFVSICTLFFLIFILLSYLRSGMPFLRGAFGQYGRGNGLFYYFIAITIFVFSAKFFDISSRAKIHQLISYFSWFLAIYAHLQKIGIDIAKLDTKELSPVVLTFGNSNFAGGMLSVLLTYHAIYLVVSKITRPRDVTLIVLLIFGTTFAGAVQGYMIVCFALLLGFSIYVLQSHKSIWLSRAVIASWIILLVSIILGVMGKFVLASVFARTTFQARIEYWKIAIAIIKDHLFLGVGPDKLYDVTANYMAPNSLKIITATRMDNAHNWYLNLAANYGIIALLFLILILGYCFTVGVKHYRSNKSPDPLGSAAFSAFVAIGIDGLVSLEQPGIGIWLYFFAGITLGNWINSKRKLVPSELKQKSENRFHNSYLMNSIAVLTISTLVITVFIISNRVVLDASLRSNIQTQLVGKGTQSTLENIGAIAIRLKQEPEYTVQALKPLANAGSSLLLDSTSIASYEYYKSSIQATLIRSEVLRALGRVDESCPLRVVLINNTPWDLSQLNEYAICLVRGLQDPNYIETLKKSSHYLADEIAKENPQSANDLVFLQNRLNAYALAARVSFYLGNQERAKQEKTYALDLLEQINEYEMINGLTITQLQTRGNLDLLNF